MLIPDIPYCENFSGFFPIQQPLNTLSNAAYLVAAWVLWGDFRPLSRRESWLVSTVGWIGVGSAIWHLFLLPQLLLLDFSGIMLFMVSAWYLALAKAGGLTGPGVHFGFIGLFVAMLVCHLLWPPSLIGGSGVFLPVFAFLGWLAWRNPGIRAGLLWSLLWFAVAFAFRLADIAACRSAPWGTHWLWHGFSAAAVYVLVKTLLSQKRI